MLFCAMEVAEFTYSINIELFWGGGKRENGLQLIRCTEKILHLTEVLIIDMTLNFDLNEAGVHYFVHHITFFKKF
jgi:hypothetical protein